ncbi:hypothetical protein F3Y22_tig00111273pilonHSYRG00075 [Hibiscus syriacus]|uniref:WEB family protein n=1 Tax=Hibiscus syriacus TaxID=106335 RepID=A0A6A2YSM6_HIBSY|nr:WEB family protein At1g75720-like [Hibiscus syriacus]KAE8682135.1 hypothetical protein F3Y22_tig00111273pilonHSYRG00075 [Hibiscus syriacus]
MDVVMMNRAEIDTTPPFNSVKEVVALFVLAGQIYAPKLSQQVNGEASEKGSSSLVTVTAELEETKYNLEKAREESMVMANCLSSLKEELERRKRELELMKEGDIKKPMMEFEMEDVRIVPGSARYELHETKTSDEGTTEFQKNRYVAFANQPSLTRVIGPQGVEKLDRHPSLRKNKKPLIALIGGLFSKKKGTPIIS